VGLVLRAVRIATASTCLQGRPKLPAVQLHLAETEDLAAYGPWLLHPKGRSPLQPPPPLVTARDCRYCWPTFISHSQAVHKYFLAMAERKLAKRTAQSAAEGAVPAGAASQ
jgi:hypothetical protein